MSPASAALPLSLTLWVWPGGMYPSRVLHYFKAKRLPETVLERIRLIPETLGPTGIKAIDGLEERPEGCSLPCLAVCHEGASGAEPQLITQASAILEYLEDMLPASAGYKALRGVDAVESGRVRDIVNIWSEAIMCSGFLAKHRYESSLLWSGMTREQQSSGAATDAERELRKRAEKLEDWLGSSLSRGESRWLAGTKEPSLADFTVASSVSYVSRMYDGLDLLEGCELLKAWFKEYQSNDALFVGAEEVAALEQGRSLDWAPVAATRRSA